MKSIKEVTQIELGAFVNSHLCNHEYKWFYLEGQPLRSTPVINMSLVISTL